MCKWEVISNDGLYSFVEAERWVIDSDYLYFYVNLDVIACFRDWKMFRRHHE